MAVTDPVSDMLTRIRNATMMNHSDVNIPTSKLKVEIARILSEHGYIDKYEVSNEGTIKINLSYKTISDKWHFDITANYIGRSRMPEISIVADNFSPTFSLFNSQITRKWDNLDVYVGGENLTNYTQPNPIIDADNPLGDDFDASLIWGPVMGRNIYVGIRYKIK